MAALEVLALNTTVPRIEAPQTGDTYTMPRAIAIAPEGLTGSAATTSFDVTQTWNTTGTPTAIKLNVTDTASNAASLLMDLQVGGASRFNVSKSGQIRAINGTGTSPAYSFINASSNAAGMWLYDVNTLALRGNGTNTGINIAQANVRLGANALAWGVDFNNDDVQLHRDAAATLAQRNGTNAQTFRIYNTFTDASNYERGKMEWASNVLRIGTEKAGTGTARALEFQTDGTTRMTLDASGNLGLGVTPSAWGSTNKALDFGTIGGISSDSSTVRFGNNGYSDSGGTFRYKVTAASFTYIQSPAIGHAWFNAPSGTAGTAITSTQAMTLDASGNLGIGATSGGERLDVNGTARFRGNMAIYAAGDRLNFFPLAAGSGVQLLSTNNGNTNYAPIIVEGSLISFAISNVEAARVKPAGQFRLVPLAATPTIGVEDGDLYYNSATNKLQLRAGGAWVDLN